MEKRRRWIWFVLSVAVILFIFSNSMESVSDSREKSYAFAEFLKRLFGIQDGWDVAQHDTVVRKSAHFAEFATCGFFLTQWVSGCQWKKKAVSFVLPLALVALVASADETIQIFFARGASVADVALDFVGGVFGIACAGAFCHRRQRKRENGA